MSDVLLVILIFAVIAVAVMQAMLLRRKVAVDPDSLRGGFDALAQGQERTERTMREEIALGRQEAATGAKGLREEVASQVKGFSDSVLKQAADVSALQQKQFESFANRLEVLRQQVEERLRLLTEDNGKRLDQMRTDSAGQSKQTREETAGALRLFNDAVVKSVAEMRLTMEKKLADLQQQNALKLDEMRQTVDEKLQGTLERRLGESFKLVSERLELVHEGLGEMRALASGVGDLKKVLVNVRIRGTWGEMQLANLLEQVLSPEQYAANVTTKPDSGDRVEFAVKLPGREEGETVWLPIDAKFPREDYERLVDASEKADVVAVEEAGKQLEIRIKSQAKMIRDKYIEPPYTTDFGILFLPVEGLYAEALRRPGLAEWVQRECRVSIAGPTTLAALLNSLQMGFRTLAIARRSSEVWKVLGAVKTEFTKFGDVLAGVKKKLQQATDRIDDVQVRTRAINKKLSDVQELPAAGAAGLFELPRDEVKTEEADKDDKSSDKIA